MANFARANMTTLKKTASYYVMHILVAALVVLIVSYGGPLLGAGIPTSSRVTLALMHTAVGAILIPVLRSTAPTR